jgi:hypothetical protein
MNWGGVMENCRLQERSHVREQVAFFPSAAEFFGSGFRRLLIWDVAECVDIKSSVRKRI